MCQWISFSNGVLLPTAGHREIQVGVGIEGNVRENVDIMWKAADCGTLMNFYNYNIVYALYNIVLITKLYIQTIKMPKFPLYIIIGVRSGGYCVVISRAVVQKFVNLWISQNTVYFSSISND